MQSAIVVSTFYHFAPLENPSALKPPILERMKALGVKGTITLAPEGINATVSGMESAISELLNYLRSHPFFATLSDRTSHFSNTPFGRSKVKVKRELISLGAKADPSVCVGTYIAPENWNALITRPDVITIDTRNDYEFGIGHFKGAINPATRHFKEMVAFTQKHLLPLLHDRDSFPSSFPRRRESMPPLAQSKIPAFAGMTKQNVSIAMYCTGGIRCEKYSAYLLTQGFQHVYHLQGGILAYLEQITPEQSLWVGDCYVFDERVAVGHGLRANPDASMCLGCGRPLYSADRAHTAYIEGSQCAKCDGSDARLPQL